MATGLKLLTKSTLLRMAGVGIAIATLLSAGSAAAGTIVYKYDAQGRVIEVDYPSGWIVTYTYDAAGNRTRTVRHN